MESYDVFVLTCQRTWLVVLHTKIVYRIAGFCHKDFNVASHGIHNIKIRYIFLSYDFIT